MKKIFISFILVVFTTVGFSQAKVELGLKGGVNMATINGGGGDNITAFHGGAYGLIKITKFGIQPEALFSKRGDNAVNLAYLDIPIMFKFYLAGGLNIQAGPQFGVLLNAEDEDGNDLSGFLEGSDLSAAAGIGLDLPMGLNLTARYVAGLKDVNSTSGGDFKSNTFQLSVGYSLFKVGK